MPRQHAIPQISAGWRKHRTALASLVLALCCSASVVAQTSSPNPWWAKPWWEGYEHHAKLVTLPDGRRLNLFCQGSGTPTVIFDSGLGQGAWSWRSVQLEVAKTTQACAYDRAGYGASDAGPPPRDANALARDLAAMLKASGLPGPYVLVGHSLGSYDVRLFAFRHPKNVAGMVLVDPASDHQNDVMASLIPGFMAAQSKSYDETRYCLARVEAGPFAPGTADYRTCVGEPVADMPADLLSFHVAYGQSPVHARAILAEFDSAQSGKDSAETVAAKRSLGAMPLIVLTGENTQKGVSPDPAQQAAAAKAWWRMHDELSRLSKRGVNRLVNNSGHFIQSDAPDQVIGAIKEVVAAAK